MISETTTTNLIVARMAAESADAVAEIFEQSDRSPLPGLVGVTRRQLFAYRGLYFHLFETDDRGASRVEDLRVHPLFAGVSSQLAAHISAYDPATWASPQDAMALRFYDWRA